MREPRGADSAVNSVFLTPKEDKDRTVKENYRPILFLIADGKYSIKSLKKLNVHSKLKYCMNLGNYELKVR